MKNLIIIMIFISITQICGHNSGFIKSDDTRLFYSVIGTGVDTVVIPLNYWNIKAFEKNVEGFTFIFYDTRGRRNSDIITDTTKLGYEFDLADLENVCKHFNISKMCLIGTSYYGALIARYTMLHPEHVSKLVMVGALYPRTEPYINYNPPETAARIDTSAQAQLIKMKQTGENRTDPEKYCRTYWKAYGALYTGDPSFSMKRKYPCDMQNEHPDNLNVWTSRLFNSLGTWDWRDEAENVKSPALIIHGTKDLLVPIESSREWAEILPNADLKIMKEAGHVPWWEFEEEMFQTVIEFLRS